MTSKNYHLAGEGVLWVQPDGPNTEPKYLGCHTLGDLSEPLGDVTLLYCPDPARPNAWNVVGSFRSAPGPVTTSIETDMNKTADYLEKIKCPASLYIGKVTCGRKNVFTAYDRMFVMERVWITQRSLGNMVAKNPDDQERSTMSFEISAEAMLRIYQLVGSRVSVAETEAFNSVSSCGYDQCADDCGSSAEAGDTLYFGGDSLAGSAGNVADVVIGSTMNDNALLEFTDADPFAAGISIAAMACVQIDRTTTRIIAVRGTTQATTGLVSYSNDGGATWNVATVTGATDLYGLGPKCIHVLDYYNIWVVTDGGHIFKSTDGGVTWAAQTSGSVQDLYAVHFANEDDGYAVGASNTILKTTDGGAAWSASVAHTDQAADTVLSVFVFNSNRVFVGYNDGELYYTHNGGTTWNRRAHTLSGAGSIPSMSWHDEYVGFVIHNTAAPVGSVLYTVDGGYSWEEISTPANAGFNDVIAIGPTLAWAVGEPQGGTAMIVKIAES